MTAFLPISSVVSSASILIAWPTSPLTLTSPSNLIVLPENSAPRSIASVPTVVIDALPASTHVSLLVSIFQVPVRSFFCVCVIIVLFPFVFFVSVLPSTTVAP